MSHVYSIGRQRAPSGRGPWAAVVFAVALALRALFVASTTITPISDAEGYVNHAKRLLDGLGFTSAKGLPTALTPPGYPFFIAGLWAVLGTDPHAVAYVQALLGAICSVLTFFVCYRLFDRRHALIAGLLLAVSPTSIAYTGNLLAEVPTTLAVMGVLLLLTAEHQNGSHRHEGLLRTGAAGLLLGAAILLRPAVMAWGLGLGLCLLLFQPGSLSRRLLATTALSAGVMVALGPWTYRNYRLYEAIVPIATNGGYNLYIGNNPRARGGGWMALDESELGHLDHDFHRDREARLRAMKWIRENPIAYAEVTLRRTLIWISVAPDYVPGIRLTSTSRIDETIVRAHREWLAGLVAPEPPAFQRNKRLNWSILLLWSLVTIPLALVGLVLDISRRPKWLLLVPLITYAGVLSLTFMQSRFRELMMPLLLIYASVGVCGLPSIHRSWVNASPRAKFALLIGLPLVLVFCLQLLRDRDSFRVALGW